MKNFFQNKKVLVAGGTGMVGQKLVPKLINLGAEVYIASLDDNSLVANKVKKFYKKDLLNLDNCIKVCEEKDIVFNLLGVTGSPKQNIDRPASFMVSNLYCALNMLVAAKKNNVKNYLFTSTYGVYAPSNLMKEEDVWKTFPSEHDKFAGWAKRIGELQIEAFSKEYNFESLHVVRPANIYGPYANFDSMNSMVVASLIRKVVDGENPLKVWGDGSAIRDFVYSEDVAEGMIQVVLKKIQKPINIGSGTGISIKELVNTIINSKKIKIKPKVIFDSDKPTGDKVRILDTSFAQREKIFPKKSLQEGIDDTIDWYLKNKNSLEKRYNYFKENN